MRPVLHRLRRLPRLSRPERPRSRRLAGALLAGLLTTIGVGTVAYAAPSADAAPATDATPAAGKTLAAAPQADVPAAPMGWASWNSLASQIDYDTIKAQVDALVSSGMAEAGYEYVNIDEGWWWGTRDGKGNITVDSKQWPGGMKAIADYIHSKGLKAGIYTDAGKNGCGYFYPTPPGTPPAPGSGSEGHYEQDLRAFQEWGFDYVKVDWCGGQDEGLNQEATYRALSEANKAATAVTGRRLVLSLCEWGSGRPWNWAAGVGDLWRTSTDIIYWGQTPSATAMLSNFDQGLHPTAQHTGYYNDPDMLMVGMKGSNATLDRTHMSLWAISGAPLLAGNDLTTMTRETAGILTNPEVIAVDQDPRGLQGVKVAEDAAGLQVYAKVLSGTGKRAVLLLNRASAAKPITARWTDLGLTGAAASVRDVWKRASVGTHSDGYTATVPAGEAVLLTVSGTEASGTAYQSTTGSFAVTAKTAGLKLADITYANGGTAPRTATLRVGGQYATTLALPPTGSATARRTVSVLLSLAKGANTVTVSGGPDAITVQDLPGTDGVQIVGADSGRCVDLDQNTISNGAQAQLWDCQGGQNQLFRRTSRDELTVYGSKCLGAEKDGTADGTKVVIGDCTGATGQKWTVNASGTLVHQGSGRCLDAYGNGTGNGTRLVLWSCHNGPNQRWTLT
ncbi:ricin-type beta-trefoil lectin domain protein [Streptomyces violaceusniger]|uniref:Alpha-galactosidase n=1 Tax=Streptomyces violaceusniger TaxID=68280 RepID=A0A4D4L6J3_STRVO|nr:alpha-galactosidase [Streptomyces violaceusniger]